MTRSPAAAASAIAPPCHSQFRTMSTCRSLCVFDELLHALQFFGIDLLVFEHVEHEQARGTVEEAGGEVSEGPAARLAFVHARLINERAADLLVGDVALGFKDAEHRLDCAVTDR